MERPKNLNPFNQSDFKFLDCFKRENPPSCNRINRVVFYVASLGHFAN